MIGAVVTAIGAVIAVVLGKKLRATPEDEAADAFAPRSEFVAYLREQLEDTDRALIKEQKARRAADARAAAAEVRAAQAETALRYYLEGRPL